MHRQLTVFSIAILLLMGGQQTDWLTAQEQPTKASIEARKDIEKLLVRYRRAGTESNGEQFFACLDPEGVFFGTDETERWTVTTLKKFLQPYFDRGVGWKREILDRKVYVGPNNQIGWFEEKSKRIDVPMRTTGVVRKTEQGWKIIQYNTSITVPNELYPKLEQLLREADRAKGDDVPK